MSDDRDIESAIEAYRQQLAAEAELARGDLDEIEDHLRTLAGELRDTGLGAAEAVAEAARRLGEPRSVAREHARVRTAFGARLSWPRAVVAALLILPILVMTRWSSGANLEIDVELAAGFLLVAALLARLSWARPILLGGFGFFVLPTAMWLATGAGASVWFVAWFVAIVAVLAPWQRREISAAGIALALQVWAYGAAAIALAYQVTSSDGEWVAVAPAAKIALSAAAIATCGGVLRAKWAAAGSAVAAIALAVAIEQMWTLRFNFGHREFYRVYLLGSLASGVVASVASALLGWTTARTKLGSLRAIFDRA